MRDEIRQARFLKKLETHTTKYKDKKGINLNIGNDFTKKSVYLNYEAAAKNDILMRRFEKWKEGERQRTGKKRINTKFEEWARGKDVSMVDVHKEMLGDVGLVGLTKKQASPAAKWLRSQGWKGMTMDQLMYSNSETADNARKAFEKHLEELTYAERQRIALEEWGKPYNTLTSKEKWAVDRAASTIIAQREMNSPD